MNKNNNLKRKASALTTLGSQLTVSSSNQTLCSESGQSQTQEPGLNINIDQNSLMGQNLNSQPDGKNFFEKVSVRTQTNGEIEMLQCLQCKADGINKYYQITTAKTNLNYHLEISHKITTAKKPKRNSFNENIDTEKIDKLLLLFLIFCFLPFVIVESQFFKDFIFSLNKDYKVPSRKKLRLLLNELYNQKKEI